MRHCGRLESVIGSPDCGRFVSRPSVSLDYAGKECRHRHLNNRLVGCSILIITDLFETAIGVHHITYHRRTIIDLLPQCYVVAYDLVFMVSEVDKVTNDVSLDIRTLSSVGTVLPYLSLLLPISSETD